MDEGDVYMLNLPAKWGEQAYNRPWTVIKLIKNTLFAISVPLTKEIRHKNLPYTALLKINEEKEFGGSLALVLHERSVDVRTFLTDGKFIGRLNEAQLDQIKALLKEMISA